MILNQNIKIFVIGLLGMAAYMQAHSIPSAVEDKQAEGTLGKWMCGVIECPSTAHRCFIKKTNKEPAVLEVINICFAEDNTILEQKNVSSPTDPKYGIRYYSNTFRNGTTLYIDENFTNREGQQQLNKTVTGTQKLNPGLDFLIQSIGKNIQNEINEMKETISLFQISEKFSKLFANTMIEMNSKNLTTKLPFMA